ncbi:hypothetical protein IRY55_04730 [Savagea sp. SN6]|uniref:Uncharacterized protein n=1 Tax=Savagea serpentis TaxID=2785297 RepID=A0A8J7GKQ3_9BACL|nr:hypothetical protein [Savagea serpentis]MBF4500663.1 hypothetical protein [Savagea serpentis]
MNKTLQWILTIAIGLVIISLAWPIASFSLFGTAEGTSIFSIDYAIAFLLMIIPLFVVGLLAVSTYRGVTKWVYAGYGLATIEMLVLAGLVFSSLPFTIFVIGILFVSATSVYGLVQLKKER